MSEVLKAAGNVLVWIASVGAAIGVIWTWIAKPIRAIGGKVDMLQENTDALMGDRLAQAHDHWIRKGYCPPQDKARLVDMHERYAARGLNHLAASYERDLIKLPDEPERKGGSAA